MDPCFDYAPNVLRHAMNIFMPICYDDVVIHSAADRFPSKTIHIDASEAALIGDFVGSFSVVAVMNSVPDGH